MPTMLQAARAAALMIGASLIALPVTVVAAEKKPAAAPAGPQLSPEFRKVALPAQTALQAIGTKLRASNNAADVNADLAAAEPLVAEAEAAAKTPDDTHFKQIFRLQIEDFKALAFSKGNAALYQQREASLVEPLKALLADPKSTQADIALYAIRLGEISFDSKNYADALKYFEQARAAGSTNPNLTLNIIRARGDSGDVAGSIAELRKLIDAERAAGRQAPESYYLYARSQLSKAKMEKELNEWSRLWVAAYPTPKSWRDAVIYYGFQGSTKLDKRERVDLFRLLRAAKALGDQNDYAEYAEDLFDVGLPNEAKAVIDEGRAAGKVPAAGGSASMIYGESQTAIKNEGSLDALAKKSAVSPNGLSAAATGDAYLGSADYAHAIELYQLALKKGGLLRPDEVTTHIGIAQALSGDTAGARTTFKSLKTPPRSDIAGYWLLWLDTKAAS